MTATEQYHRDQAADDNREAKIDNDRYLPENFTDAGTCKEFDRQRWLDSLKIGDKVDAYVEHADYYNGIKTLIAPPPPYEVPDGPIDAGGFFWGVNDAGTSFCLCADWLLPFDDAGMTPNTTGMDAWLEVTTVAVKAEDFPIGQPRVSSHDFTEFGLIQTYHKSSNTITHEPDGWANGDDCQFKVVETWYADEFERAALYVLDYDRWAEVMQSDNLQAIHLILLNIWSFDDRWMKRHHKQHPEAAEREAGYERAIPF